MNVLLDSAFVIDQLNGRPQARIRWLQMFEAGDNLLINDVVVCEVSSGLLPHERIVLERLLEPLEFVQPGPDAAVQAGSWRAEARARGRTLSLADALIAAAALFNGAVVLTRNMRDFSLTPVEIETY
jgi:predicted nucleic acid-binding protein